MAGVGRRERQGGRVPGVGGDQLIDEGGGAVSRWIAVLHLPCVCPLLYLVVKVTRVESQWNHRLLQIPPVSGLVVSTGGVHGG